MLLKCYIQYASKFGKLSSATGLENSLHFLWPEPLLPTQCDTIRRKTSIRILSLVRETSRIYVHHSDFYGGCLRDHSPSHLNPSTNRNEGARLGISKNPTISVHQSPLSDRLGRDPKLQLTTAPKRPQDQRDPPAGAFEKN